MNNNVSFNEKIIVTFINNIIINIAGIDLSIQPQVKINEKFNEIYIVCKTSSLITNPTSFASEIQKLVTHRVRQNFDILSLVVNVEII